jgi:hypothetical protein
LIVHPRIEAYADQAAKGPRPIDRWSGCQWLDCVQRVVLRGRGLLLTLDGEVDLGGGKAEQFEIEVEVDKTLHFDGQDIAIPAGVLGQLVVGKDIGPDLIARKMRELSDRHFKHAKLFGRLNTAVACDDGVVFGDEDGIAKAEAFYAFGNLVDLLLRMRPCVVGVGTSLSIGHDCSFGGCIAFSIRVGLGIGERRCGAAEERLAARVYRPQSARMRKQNCFCSFRRPSKWL